MSIRSAWLILLLGLAAGGQAQAQDSLRCAGQVVRTGDRSFDVQRKCGNPSFRDEWDEYVLYHYPAGGHVEEWFYNFGPSRLVHVLRFRNDRLLSVATDGYGFNESDDAASCNPYEIVSGMSQFELVARCGEPEARERRLEYRSHPRRDGRFTYPVTVRVDEWTYNFGTSHFIRHLTLVNGRVDEIELGERGY